MRRTAWLVVLLVYTTVMGAQTTLRVRPRIDDPNEAANTALYVRAVKALMARDADPNHRNDPATPEKNSYNWFAELHNGDDFAPEAFCRHGNELFLPWHRALLVLYERALQQSDPPDTLALRLPYWNWSNDPRFPAVFQNGGPLFFPGRTPGVRGRTFTTAELRQTISSTFFWSGFGGGECSAPPGCKTGDCVRCVSRFGSLESPSHNQMHNWVGGAMLNDTTAGHDPLFWSFHTYIDLLYDCWQQTSQSFEHGCPDCPLNMLPGWTPAQVARTSALGYTYDFRMAPCGVVPPIGGDTLPPLAAAADVADDDGAEHPATKPAFVDVTIPAYTFSTAHVRLAGLENLPAFNYSGEVYLFPASTSFAPSQKWFRERYRVGDFAVWGNASKGHEHHPGEVTADVEATTELAYLAKKHEGEKWRLAVVVKPPNPQDDAKTTVEQAAGAITIDDVSIVYDRDFPRREYR